MAAPWVFVKVSNDFFVKFSKQNEDKNAVKKADYDLRIFRKYLTATNGQWEIETLMFSRGSLPS